MATQTPYYNLKKPAGADMASPTPFNENMDIIDTALKALSDRFFIVDSNTTVTQIEAAYTAGRRIMAVRNGVLYPSMIRNGTNDYVFSTAVPTGDNNANTSVLYLKVTSSGWDSTTYQRDLALKTYVDTGLAEKTGLPKAVKYHDMEFEAGVAATSFSTSFILGHTVTPNKTMVIATNENVSVSNVTAERIYLTRSSTTGGLTVGVIVLEFN